MKTSQDIKWAKQQHDRAVNERAALAALRNHDRGLKNLYNLTSNTALNNKSLDGIVLNTAVNPAYDTDTSPLTPEISQIGYANPIKTYLKRFVLSAKRFALSLVAAAIFITGCDTSEMLKLAYNLKNPVKVSQEGSVRIERYEVRKDLYVEIADMRGSIPAPQGCEEIVLRPHVYKEGNSQVQRFGMITDCSQVPNMPRGGPDRFISTEEMISSRNGNGQSIPNGNHAQQDLIQAMAKNYGLEGILDNLKSAFSNKPEWAVREYIPAIALAPSAIRTAILDYAKARVSENDLQSIRTLVDLINSNKLNPLFAEAILKLPTVKALSSYDFLKNGIDKKKAEQLIEANYGLFAENFANSRHSLGNMNADEKTKFMQDFSLIYLNALVPATDKKGNIDGLNWDTDTLNEIHNLIFGTGDVYEKDPVTGIRPKFNSFDELQKKYFPKVNTREHELLNLSAAAAIYLKSSNLGLTVSPWNDITSKEFDAFWEYNRKARAEHYVAYGTGKISPVPIARHPNGDIIKLDHRDVNTKNIGQLIKERYMQKFVEQGYNKEMAFVFGSIAFTNEFFDHTVVSEEQISRGDQGRTIEIANTNMYYIYKDFSQNTQSVTAAEMAALMLNLVKSSTSSNSGTGGSHNSIALLKAIYDTEGISSYVVPPKEVKGRNILAVQALPNGQPLFVEGNTIMMYRLPGARAEPCESVSPNLKQLVGNTAITKFNPLKDDVCSYKKNADKK